MGALGAGPVLAASVDLNFLICNEGRDILFGTLAFPGYQSFGKVV